MYLKVNVVNNIRTSIYNLKSENGYGYKKKKISCGHLIDTVIHKCTFYE